MKRLQLFLCIGSLLGLCGLVLYALLPAPPSFPNIPPGVYFGELRGFEKSPESRMPIYVESIAKTSSLLIVPLEEGISPELHPLAPSSRVKKAYEPIVIRLKDISVTLAGEASGDSFEGTLEPKGSWALHPLDARKLRESTAALHTAVELPRWLQVKVQSAATISQLDDLKSNFTKEKERLRSLEDLLGNEKLLKERSDARREALASEIDRVTEKKRKLAEGLRNSLDDLSVLHRVRIDGQSVEVARRILKREERWFDGTPGEDSGDESLEEQLAANDQVDLQKLNAAAKRAEEIQELKRNIAEEQSQLQILNAEYQRRVVQRVAPGAGR